MPPKTASVVFESRYEWSDAAWIERRTRPRAARRSRCRSTRCMRRRGGKGLGWRSSPTSSRRTCDDLGFTHVELLPVMHHPFSGSWGYQVTGFYAPVSTMGSPDDFRDFVDRCTQTGSA